ncbi:cytosolic Fe-S cluster assembly factor nubp2 [Stigmatopora argus]
MEQKVNDGGSLSQVEHVLLVLSGKGGVGKSTITAELALALRHAGKKVGILDVDLCGPSIPRMLKVADANVHQCDSGWVPVYADAEKSLALMSIGFLLDNPDEAVVWRGPKKTAMIGQFVSDVAWGELDVLLVDTPPGTSDEHLAILENLKKQKKVDGAVLVTTPQAVSTGDVRREATFCKKTGIRIVGIIENMSGFVCPHCSECSNIFSKGGGEELAKLIGSTFLGSVPLDPQLSASVEEGKDFLQSFPDSATFSSISSITKTILTSLQNPLNDGEM